MNQAEITCAALVGAQFQRTGATLPETLAPFDGAGRYARLRELRDAAATGYRLAQAGLDLDAISRIFRAAVALRRRAGPTTVAAAQRCDAIRAGTRAARAAGLELRNDDGLPAIRGPQTEAIEIPTAVR